MAALSETKISGRLIQIERIVTPINVCVNPVFFDILITPDRRSWDPIHKENKQNKTMTKLEVAILLFNQKKYTCQVPIEKV